MNYILPAASPTIKRYFAIRLLPKVEGLKVPDPRLALQGLVDAAPRLTGGTWYDPTNGLLRPPPGAFMAGISPGENLLLSQRRQAYLMLRTPRRSASKRARDEPPGRPRYPLLRASPHASKSR